MSSLGSAVSGNRYQVGAFWYYASQLLTDDSLELVEFESGSTKVIDDVICRYSKPRPIQGTSLTYLSDYFQIKYHVDHKGALSHTYLIDEDAVSTKKSILERFYEAFQKLNDNGNSRLNLVTNWRWDHNDPLAGVVRRAHFNTGYIKTKKEEDAVNSWIEKLGCDRPAFEAFANRLTFRSSFDLFDQREALNDRLRLAGLIPLDFEVEHNPYDDLGLKLIEAGKTTIDRTYLIEFAKQNKIYDKDAERTNSQNVLAIRSFKKVFDSATPALEANLTDLFINGRTLDSKYDWTNDVHAELASALDPESMKILVNPIEAHLDCHLSIAFSAGRLLAPKKGFQINLRQRVRGAPEIWASKQLNNNPANALNSDFQGSYQNKDLVVSIAVSRDIHEDVAAAAKSKIGNFDLLKLTAPNLGQTSVASGDAAWTMAESFSNAVIFHLKKYGTRPTVHLFLGTPGGLAFRMGQESSILGPVNLYEFDFEGSHKYSPSIQLT